LIRPFFGAPCIASDKINGVFNRSRAALGLIIKIHIELTPIISEAHECTQVKGVIE